MGIHHHMNATKLSFLTICVSTLQGPFSVNIKGVAHHKVRKPSTSPISYLSW